MGPLQLGGKNNEIFKRVHEFLGGFKDFLFSPLIWGRFPF